MYYIQLKSYPNPYSTTPLVNPVGAIIVSNFNHLGPNGRIELGIYTDLASAKANLNPIAKRDYPIPTEVSQSMDGRFVLPPLTTIEANNLPVFEALIGVFFTLLLGDPELAGATMLGDQ